MASRDPLGPGRDALAAGDWALAKESFAEAARESGSPDAVDGLGRALWWLKDVRAAIETRTRAHSMYKSQGRSGLRENYDRSFATMRQPTGGLREPRRWR